MHRVVIFSSSSPCCIRLMTPMVPHASCLFEIKKKNISGTPCGAGMRNSYAAELAAWAVRIFSKCNSVTEIRSDECLKGILQLTGVFCCSPTFLFLSRVMPDQQLMFDFFGWMNGCDTWEGCTRCTLWSHVEVCKCAVGSESPCKQGSQPHSTGIHSLCMSSTCTSPHTLLASQRGSYMQS